MQRHNSQLARSYIYAMYIYNYTTYNVNNPYSEDRVFFPCTYDSGQPFSQHNLIVYGTFCWLSLWWRPYIQFWQILLTTRFECYCHASSLLLLLGPHFLILWTLSFPVSAVCTVNTGMLCVCIVQLWTLTSLCLHCAFWEHWHPCVCTCVFWTLTSLCLHGAFCEHYLSLCLHCAFVNIGILCVCTMHQSSSTVVRCTVDCVNALNTCIWLG